MKYDTLKYLREIKARVGRRTFPEEIVKDLIRRGLVAGDHSRLYVTDRGDDFMESPEAFEFMEELRGS